MKPKPRSQRLVIHLCLILLTAWVALFTVTGNSLAASWEASALILTPDANITELNIAWYSRSNRSSLVRSL
jgi:hypothetical protein